MYHLLLVAEGAEQLQLIWNACIGLFIRGAANEANVSLSKVCVSPFHFSRGRYAGGPIPRGRLQGPLPNDAALQASVAAWRQSPRARARDCPMLTSFP